MINRQALAAAIPARHSVRQFTDKPLEPQVVEALQEAIAAANRESGLSFQLMTDEPNAFNYFVARYGSFRNVRNYIACVGPEGPGLHEAVGYWGQLLVLTAQALGLNSCWVALSFRRRKTPAAVEKGQKIACTIALGYGENPGKSHKVKSAEQVSSPDVQPAPSWFEDGVRAALLAPTAVNQQKFFLALKGERVEAKATGGAYCEMDLGIVKRNFEIASGKDHNIWL